MNHADAMKNPDDQAHAGPSRRSLTTLAAVLFVVTLVEFGIIYLHGMRTFVMAVLAILSALKFFYVGSIFMHLRFDPRLLAGIFGIGIFNALWMSIALRYILMRA